MSFKKNINYAGVETGSGYRITSFCQYRESQKTSMHVISYLNKVSVQQKHGLCKCEYVAERAMKWTLLHILADAQKCVRAFKVFEIF